MNDAATEGSASPSTICPSCGASVAAPASRCSQCGEWLTDPEKLIEPRPDDVLGGRYHLLSLVGVGGMARVWRAHDLETGREVAVKLLGAEQIGDRAAEERFLNEGKTARAIRHPNVVEVFDHGLFSNGMPFIAMELLEGKLLSELLRQVGAVAPERALRLMIQLTGAVAEAHRQGLVHRDVKPDNVFVVPPQTDGRPERAVLLDFGISIHAETLEAGESRDGLGTPAYAAPEQRMGDPLGARADVYSLGVVMYQLLTGMLPGKQEVIGEGGVRRTARIAPSEGKGPTAAILRGALQKIVVQALSPDAKQRQVNAGHLLRDLERAAPLIPRDERDGFGWKSVVAVWWWLPALIVLVAVIATVLWFVGRAGL